MSAHKEDGLEGYTYTQELSEKNAITNEDCG